MIDLTLIVDRPRSLSNFQRITTWRLRWRDRFGRFPDSNFYLVRPCRTCRKPVWILPHDFDLNGAYCAQHMRGNNDTKTT